MSSSSHLTELKNRHNVLEQQVAAEQKRPQPNAEVLSSLKRRKLMLKEEIERMQAALAA